MKTQTSSNLFDPNANNAEQMGAEAPRYITHQLPIVGLRHHDYKEDIAQLAITAIGQTVSISEEDNNSYDNGAMCACMKGLRLGYVRRGYYRQLAWTARRSMDCDVLIGRVAEVDVEARVAWVEVKMPVGTVPGQPELRIHPFTGWSYDGPVLPTPRDYELLKNQASALRNMLLQCSTWNQDMERCLDVIERFSWFDISREANLTYNDLLDNVMQRFRRDEEGPWREVSSRLQLVVDGLGGGTAPERLVAWMREAAHSTDMEMMIASLPDAPEATAALLPRVVVRRYAIDPVGVVRCMLYYGLSRYELWAAISLLSLTERVADEKNRKAAVGGHADVLLSPKARQLWSLAIDNGWVDADLQPLMSLNKAAILASVMADELHLVPKWGAFERLWGVERLANKLSRALSQKYFHPTMSAFEAVIRKGRLQ